MPDAGIPLASLPEWLTQAMPQGVPLASLQPAPAGPSRLDALLQFLTPEWSKPFAGMSPQQANEEARLLQGPQQGGKIGPGYLSDTDRAGMAAADAASWLMPELKGAAAVKGMASPAAMALARKYVPTRIGEEAFRESISPLDADAKRAFIDSLYGDAAAARDERQMDAIGRDTYRMEQESGFILVKDPAQRARMGMPPLPGAAAAPEAPASSGPSLLDIIRKAQQQSLTRDVTSRSRSGRPLQSAPFSPEADQRILEEGAGRAGRAGNRGAEGRPPIGAQSGFTSPPVGDRLPDMASMSSGKINAGAIEDFLRQNDIPFAKQTSASASDRFGPSASVYYNIDTPGGKQTIRLSDHSYGNNPLDFRYGHDAAPAFERILKAAGQDVPPDLARGAAESRIAATKAQIAELEAQYADPQTPGRKNIKFILNQHRDLLRQQESELQQASDSQPLLRQVLSRGRSGRPIQSAPFSPEADQRILEEGYNRSVPPPSFQAYHGSPHDFDRFDLSRIGTGEGVQAYGHGLYFAETEGVAKEYRDTLAKSRNISDAMNSAWERAGDLSEKMRSLTPGTKEFDAANAEYRAAVDYANSLKPDNPGRMYQVAIKADPSHFLDWDKPLSEQPKVLRDALPGLIEKYGGDLQKLVSASGRLRETTSGESIYQALSKAMAGNEAFTRNPPHAAEALRSAGIPGIKYLDQGSRAGGDGTRNYVVFDDKLIDIIKKYGLAGLAMLPALGASQSPRVPLSSLPELQ